MAMTGRRKTLDQELQEEAQAIAENHRKWIHDREERARQRFGASPAFEDEDNNDDGERDAAGLEVRQSGKEAAPAGRDGSNVPVDAGDGSAPLQQHQWSEPGPEYFRRMGREERIRRSNFRSDLPPAEQRRWEDLLLLVRMIARHVDHKNVNIFEEDTKGLAVITKR